MCLPVAASLQMHRPVHTAAANREDGVTGLVRPLVNAKSLIAESKHFRHERQVIEAAVLVQGPQDFLATPDFHPVSGLKMQR